MRQDIHWSLLIVMLFLIFVSGSFAADMDNSRLVPEGKVTVLKDGKKIGEYTQEMPLPEGVLLSCKGKCAVKLDDMSVVAEDQSLFSIDSENNDRLLNVREGLVYFGIFGDSRPLVFITPKGAVYSDQILINVTSDRNMLEGYVKVTKDSSELGVIDGGSILLTTKDGRKMIKSGERLLLTMANVGPVTDDNSKAGETLAGWWKSMSLPGKIAAGTITAGVVGSGAYFIKRSNDHSTGTFSPSTPTPQ
jgi:hypothetical protein